MLCNATTHSRHYSCIFYSIQLLHHPVDPDDSIPSENCSPLSPSPSIYFVPSIFSQCILSPIKTQSSSNLVNVAPPSPALLLPLTVLLTLPLLALLIMWSSLYHQFQLGWQDTSSFLLWSLYLLWYTRNTRKHRNQSKLLQQT